MSQLTFAGVDGTQTQLDSSLLTGLATAFRGQVLTPGSDGYDQARSIWNAMIDRKPGMIVQATCAADIASAVRFAKAHGLLVAVKGAGHNIAGNAVCDGGMVIDLSGMRTVSVDASTRMAAVDPGATLADVDAACLPHELALPVGINSTTGIAGLTLGGGFGWLSRKHGMTIDSLESAEVVTADGEIVTASATENADLFWGLRGGGGNFGVVSQFHFRLHPQNTEVLSGLVIYPFAAARELLQYYREFCKTAPDELTVWVVTREAPPAPFVPTEWHGKKIIAFACCYSGDLATGEQLLRPLREFDSKITDIVGPNPYVGWQQAFDPLMVPGLRNYWKTHDFSALSDGLIDAFINAVEHLPSPHSEIFIGQLGGATARVDADATAFGDRNAKFMMNVHGRWETPAEDQTVVQWCREVYAAATPYATGQAYVNFMTGEESARVGEAYGRNYDRLRQVKRKYDPGNLFRMNQNIEP